MTAAATARGYGGFTLGDMQLALPMSALREVVPLQELISLPCPAACVVGGIDLRGVVVPVLDLHGVLGRRGEPGPQPCVIIMVHEGRLLGLRADGITGVFMPSASKSAGQEQMAPGGQIFSGSLCREDSGVMVSLLSPDALSRLPQVPMTPDPEPERQLIGEGHAGDVQQVQSVPVMLIRVGKLALAIDALAVHATLSEPRLHASAVAMGHCRGVMDYDGRRIPAVDLISLCGLGQMDSQGALQAFVVRFDRGLVALLVDEVMDVIHVRREDVVPVPAFALPVPVLFAGALPASVVAAEIQARRGAAVPQYLLLDGQALQAHAELQALAEVNTQVGDAVEGGGGKAPAGQPQRTAHAAQQRQEMITYELFGEEATPIGQIAEILRYDPSMAVFESGGPLLGLMVSRGRSIPVMCLRRMAGTDSGRLDGDSSVLVVKSDSDWVGFAVPRLRAIESARWSPALPGSGMGEGDALAQNLHSREMALMDSGGEERMLRVLDLARIAGMLRGAAEPLAA